MSNNQLRFVTLNAISFAGINKDKHAKIELPEGHVISEDIISKLDPDKGILIHFPIGFNYIEAQGDQGNCKTSLAQAFIELGGGDAPKNALNTVDNDKKLYGRFWGKDGKLYDVAFTKTGVTLHEVATNEDGSVQVTQKGVAVRNEVKRPKERLAELVGPTGISPLKVATMEPAKQVEWLRSLYTYDQEVIKAEADLNKKYSTAFEQRTTNNQKLKIRESALQMNDYYKRMEYWRDFIKETEPKYADVEKQVKDIQEEYETYQKVETGLEILRGNIDTVKQQIIKFNEDIVDIDEQIKRLQELRGQKTVALAENETHRDELLEKEKKGKKWLEDNKAIKENHDNISKLATEATEFQLQKQAFNDMMKQKEDADELENEKIRLTNLVDAYREKKREFIKTFSPQIPEFEICIPDEEEKRTGLYFRGKPLTHLAESEQWEWFVPLCKELNIQLIVVENISNLGSGSVQKFNEFIQNGAYIFGTKMNREVKELEISFNTRIK